MIYFYNDGACDYYTRENSSAAWYVNDGHNDTNYNYTVVGNTLKVSLGSEKQYDIKANFSELGELTLLSDECEYFDDNYKDFLKSKVSRTFAYYEMKKERAIDNVSVSNYSDVNPVIFEINETYETSDNQINLKVTYKNDNFLKTVYVRFNTTMLNNKQGFNTSSIYSLAQARGYYKSTPFVIYYKVVA